MIDHPKAWIREIALISSVLIVKRSFPNLIKDMGT